MSVLLSTPAKCSVFGCNHDGEVFTVNEFGPGAYDGQHEETKFGWWNCQECEDALIAERAAFAGYHRHQENMHR